MRNIFYIANAKRGKENKKNGLDFEFRVLRYYKRRSDVFYAIRSAGSHGFADVLVRFRSGKYRLVLCKRNGYFDPKEIREMQKFKDIIKPYEEVYVHYFKSAKKIARRRLM